MGYGCMASAELISPRYGKRGYAPTLGWYLAKGWALTLLFTLLSLAAFMGLMNMLEALRLAAGHPTTPGMAALMSLLKLPDLLLQLWPFAVLIATLVWLQGLNARAELVALRAAGLAARRFLLTPLLTCMVLSVVVVAVGNPVAATLMKRYQTWENQLFPTDARGVLTPAGSLWLRHDFNSQAASTQPQAVKGNSLFLYGAQVAGQGTQLISATAFMFDASYTLQLRLDAAQAHLRPGQWRLTDVIAMRPNQAPQAESAVVIPTDLTPAALAASLNPPPTLNALELYKLVAVLQANGWPSAPHRLMLANLFMLPMLALAMLLLAVPFGLRTARTRSILASVGVGLLLGFGFYALRNWAGAYALAGRLEPWLAASVPVVVGVLLAFFLLTWLREE